MNINVGKQEVFEILKAHFERLAVTQNLEVSDITFNVSGCISYAVNDIIGTFHGVKVTFTPNNKG